VKPESPDIVSIDVVSDTHVPDAPPPRPPFTLTATLFGALRTSLFEARMLPADFCNCLRRTDERSGALVFLAGTMAMTTFLFLRVTHDPLEFPREAVTRGEPRIRPSDHGPGAGSSWLPRFAQPRCLDRRDTFTTYALSRSRRGSLVPIDVHGSLDRAKDVSPKRGGAF